MVTLKNQAELDLMREAGHVVATTLERVVAAAEPGISLIELDAIGAACITEHGARPTFLNYHPGWAAAPYPHVLCLSVNDVVVHGLPDGQVLADGDVLSIDCGAEIGGYHGDAAVTVQVGRTDPGAERLMAVTSEALAAGIAAAVPGGRLGDISHAVESTVRPHGYGILAGNGGHGIGTAMHEDPHVPNTGRAGRGMRLREGLTIAIEPLVTEGGRDRGRLLPDGWSVATADGGRAAHFEHSIAVTPDGPEILTQRR